MRTGRPLSHRLLLEHRWLTIITTCKNAGDDPYAYLLDVLRRMPLLKTNQLGTLIPERWTAKPAAPAAAE